MEPIPPHTFLQTEIEVTEINGTITFIIDCIHVIQDVLPEWWEQLLEDLVAHGYLEHVCQLQFVRVPKSCRYYIDAMTDDLPF